jgi:Zn-dependent oligopeptidase
MSNALMGDWGGAFGLPPFGAIGDEDFRPAFDAALAEARANVAAIAGSGEAPTFANVIEALEVWGVCFTTLLVRTAPRRGKRCRVTWRRC